MRAVGHIVGALAVGVLAAAAVSASATDRGSAAAAPRPEVVTARPDQRIETVGRSVRGRPIVARVIGDPDAQRSVLVVGCVHGTERAGEAVTRALRRAGPPEGTNWWVIDRANPDGCQAGTRQNARGVDLNRNAAWRWGTGDARGGTYYAGTRAWSEPESRAIRDLVERLRPAVSVWFHQHAALVDLGSADNRIQRAYARRVGLPAREYGTVRGSLTSWQNATVPHSTAFVVELRAGRLTPADVADHVRAIEAL